jgi:hypothetical protein
MTKQLNVEPLENIDSNAEIKVVAFLMDGVKRNGLDQLPWPKYGYLPEVEFAIAYNMDAIFLKYYVTEKNTRATHSAVNAAVWEDSCVEFFISFDDEDNYYNFEFNCIGTALVGYGPSKHDRELLPVPLIKQVKYQAVIDNHSQNNIHWEMTLSIPKTLFCFNELNTLCGKNCRANFYKCGDNLLTPHFAAWSPIQSEEPNFHLPGFFGNLYFI